MCLCRMRLYNWYSNCQFVIIFSPQNIDLFDFVWEKCICFASVFISLFFSHYCDKNMRKNSGFKYYILFENKLFATLFWRYMVKYVSCIHTFVIVCIFITVSYFGNTKINSSIQVLTDLLSNIHVMFNKHLSFISYWLWC